MQSCMSSVVVDSRGLWLMPLFSPRTKSMAWGITSCNFMASWPAPLGITKRGTPKSFSAFSQRCCHSGALGAAGARKVASRWQTRPRRLQISSRAFKTSFSKASRCGSVGARMSIEKRHLPGTTLMEPLGTCSWPMVATESPSAAARFSM